MCVQVPGGYSGKGLLQRTKNEVPCSVIQIMSDGLASCFMFIQSLIMVLVSLMMVVASLVSTTTVSVSQGHPARIGVS